MNSKLIFARLLAVILLVIPGLAATYGFLEIKNSTFDYFAAHGDDSVVPKFAWFQFLKGIVLFAAGVGFIGGWIFYRDRKRNYVAPRFRKKKQRPNR